MAIHKRLDRYTRVTKFQCDTCRKYIEEDERNFFSKTTKDTTEMLCPVCYARARTFQWVTGVFAVFVVGVLLFGLFSTLI